MALYHTVNGPVDYTVVGNPTIVDGIASGFSATDYLSMQNNIPKTSDILYHIKFTTGPDVPGVMILARHAPFCGPRISQLGDFGYGVYYLEQGVEDTRVFYLSGTSNRLQANTTYIGECGLKDNKVFIRLFNSSGTLIVEEEHDYEDDVSGAEQTIGRPSTFAFNGSIDLNETYIKVNGQAWFGNCPVEVNNIVIGGAETQETVTGNNALSLPDAKANSLTSVVLDGATEQRNIPAEYTQVNYVTNTAKTWLDTGVKFDFSKNYEIEIRARGTVGSWYIFQARETASASQSGISGSTTGNTIILGFNGSSIATSQVSRINGNIYYVKGTINNGNLTLYVKDETAGTEETVTGTYTVGTGQSVNIGLLGNGTIGGGGLQAVDINSDIYFARIKEDGNYILNYVPCRQSATAGFYDKASSTFKTTTDLVADGNTVPSPTTPMDIVCNNGALKYNNNIADNTITGQGTFVSPNPSTTNRVYKYFGKLTPGEYTIAITGGFEFITQYRNADPPVAGMTYGNIGTWSTSGTYTLDNPDYFYGIAIRYPNDGAIAPSDFDGTIALRPNFVNVDGTQETVQVTGKNLFDTQWQVGIYNTTSGEFTPTVNRICNTNMIPIKPSTSYTVSCPDYALSNGMRWVFYDANKNFISAITNGATTVSTPSNAKYINFYIANNLTVETAPNLQLEQGSTATTYEPYFNGGTATAQRLLKVGTYKDTQEVISGTVTRNVGVKVFDGTESWSTGSATNPNRYTLAAAFNDLADLIDDNIGYSNCYTVISRSTSIQSSLQNNECGWNTTKVFCVRDDRIATLADWKQFLTDQYNAGTPVIVVYPLATATTESVTAQTLTVQQGANTLSATGSISTLGLSATYTKGTQLKPDYVIRNDKLVWAKPNMYLTGPVNYTAQGSPTITDGVVSGFSQYNYLEITDDLHPATNPFEFKLKIKITGGMTAAHFVFRNQRMYAYIADWKPVFAFRTDGEGQSWSYWTTYKATGSVAAFTSNTDYYIKIGYNGTSFYWDSSIDDEQYTRVLELSASGWQDPTLESYESKTTYIGHSPVAYFFPGSIDLKETYIKVNDQLWFYGKNYASQNIAPVPSGYTYGTTTTSAIGFVDMRTQVFTAAPTGATIGRDS